MFGQPSALVWVFFSRMMYKHLGLILLYLAFSETEFVCLGNCLGMWCCSNGTKNIPSNPNPKRHMYLYIRSSFRILFRSFFRPCRLRLDWIRNSGFQCLGAFVLCRLWIHNWIRYRFTCVTRELLGYCIGSQSTYLHTFV